MTEIKYEEKVHTDTVIGYLDYVHQYKRLCHKIFFNSETGVPDKTPRLWKIFYKDGTEKSTTSWSSLVAHVKDAADNDVEINIEKMKQHIKNTYPDVAKRQMSVRVLVEASDAVTNTNEENNSEESLTDVKERVNLPLVKEQAKDLPAKKFKKWLKEYLLTFPTVYFNVHPATGVQKIIEQLTQYVEENNV